MANAPYYASYFGALLGSGINHVTGDIRVLLLKDTYTLDAQNHLYVSQILSHEVTGTGYTTLGKVLQNKVKSVDAANSRVKFDADDVTWANSTITARYAAIYLYTGDPTTSPLMYFIDLLVNKISGGGDFIIQWHADGIGLFKGVAS